MTERELDQIIDGALESYLADPLPGLDQRIAARAGQWARPTSGYWLLGGVATAAAVLAVMWLPWSTPLPMPAPPVLARTGSTPSASTVPVLARPAARQVRRLTAMPVTQPPGVPMSPEERQLLEFAASHPELLQQVLANASQQLSGPLRVEPIVIKPLEVTSVGE